MQGHALALNPSSGESLFQVGSLYLQALTSFLLNFHSNFFKAQNPMRPQR